MVTTARLRQLAVLCACSAMIGCSGAMRIERKVGPSLDRVDGKARRLKVHTRDGEVYVLSPWTAAPDGIVGRGERWGPDRSLRDIGATYHIALGDVAAFETDTRWAPLTNLPMAALTVASGALSALVISFVLSFAHDFSRAD